jgi:hypothetical protein
MEIVIALVLLMLALANLVEFLAIRKFGNVSLTMYRDNRAELRMLGESVREIARRRREPRGGALRPPHPRLRQREGHPVHLHQLGGARLR